MQVPVLPFLALRISSALHVAFCGNVLLDVVASEHAVKTLIITDLIGHCRILQNNAEHCKLQDLF